MNDNFSLWDLMGGAEEEAVEINMITVSLAEKSKKEIKKEAKKEAKNANGKAETNKANGKAETNKANGKAEAKKEKTTDEKLKEFTEIELKVFGNRIKLINDPVEIQNINTNALQRELVSLGFGEFTKEIVWHIVELEDKTKCVLIASPKFSPKG